MAIKIIVFGLPGSGKTTISKEIKTKIEASGKTVTWLNADEVRKQFDDWDFSHDGRIRQAYRMRDLASKAETDYVIADFVAPLHAMRWLFKPDWTVWMDTIREGRFEDTNKMFEDPKGEYDFRVTEFDSVKWADYITTRILNDNRRPTFNNRCETAQLLGRYQPWHDGHKALFERALSKSGQVVIMVRDCAGWNDSNPFNSDEVIDGIRRSLDPLYQGMYKIMVVPNITEIVYGRDVGYKITQEVLDEETQKISATKIRKDMGLE